MYVWTLAAGALALARCLPFLVWPSLDFDADQAVVGLMAKHLSEGRAFPVFQYGQSYVLMIEAWLTALVFIVAGVSVTTLKVVPALFNVTLVALAHRALTRAGLAAPLALVAVLPIALPGPVASAELVAALGMTVEPLLFSLLIWWLRDRPVLLGLVAAVGVLTREFTLYALVALGVIDVWRRADGTLWRARLGSAAVFAATWVAVGMLRRFSSPAGPGTGFDAASATGNLGVVMSFVCLEPGQMPSDVVTVATWLLPLVLGLGEGPLFAAGVNSSVELAARSVWPIVALALTAGAAAGFLHRPRSGPAPVVVVGVFLLLIGLQAVAAYATTRCGSIGVGSLRYLLPAMLGAVGALTLAFSVPRDTVWRAGLLAVVAVWVGICTVDLGRVVLEYRGAPPPAEHAQLTRHLLDRGIHFIRTDYWTGYAVAFLSGERIVPLTDFQRIDAYTTAVEAHASEVVDIRRLREGGCPGGVPIGDWFICSAQSAVEP